MKTIQQTNRYLQWLGAWFTAKRRVRLTNRTLHYYPWAGRRV